jgi:hypothetical protein
MPLALPTPCVRVSYRDALENLNCAAHSWKVDPTDRVEWSEATLDQNVRHERLFSRATSPDHAHGDGSKVPTSQPVPQRVRTWKDVVQKGCHPKTTPCTETVQAQQPRIERLFPQPKHVADNSVDERQRAHIQSQARWIDQLSANTPGF